MSESSAPKGIDAVPAENQLIQHENTTYNTIREGLAYILVPPNARTSTDPKAAGAAAAKKEGEQDAAAEQVQSVFYNPIQQFNRDLSVLAIKAFGEDVMAKRQRKRQQTRAKKDKKRQTVSRDDDGNAHGEAAESKRRKGNDGEVVPVENEAALESTKVDQEQQQQQQQQQQEESATEPNPPPPSPPPSRFRILDALSATGLRALRYASEIPFATSVVSNDMSEAAVASIALNVRHNNLTSKITPSTGNAIGHMYQAAFATAGSSSEAWAQGKYDVVDLDPYGTAVPFLDAAIQSLNDGGLLCVTCTDAGVFASCGYVEKTFSLYGGLPVKGPHSHEAGLRLILYSIASSAAKYGIAIEPLLSLSIDYYARVFVRIKRSPAEVKFLAGKTMLVHSCDAGCGSWQTQFLARHVAQNGRFNFKHLSGQSNSDKNCPHCGFKTHVAGPMWGGPIHNSFFIQRILDALPNLDTDVYQTTLRIEGMLTSALDELDVLPSVTTVAKATAPDATTAPFIPATPPHLVDPFPFFFVPSNLSKILHCRAPSEAAIKGALRRLGYIATRSHCKPGTIKTQAPFSVIWEIFREWVRQKAPIKADKVVEKMAGFKILQKLRIEETKTEDEKEGGEKGEKDVLGEVAVDVGKIRAEEAREAVEGGKRSSPPPVDVQKFRVVFDEQLGKDVLRKKLTRYQVNPRDNWGPMARAKGHA